MVNMYNTDSIHIMNVRLCTDSFRSSFKAIAHKIKKKSLLIKIGKTVCEVMDVQVPAAKKRPPTYTV